MRQGRSAGRQVRGSEVAGEAEATLAGSDVAGEAEATLAGRDPQFLAILESAARLQTLVPDAVAVGGTVVTLYAAHRVSSDHDHVLADLADHFEMVLEAVERDEGWATNRVTPGKVILGNLDGIEAGVRQMIRKVALEVVTVRLPSGSTLRVTSPEETLRVKAFLVVRRNQTRDYLDVAALADRMGLDRAAAVLVRLDSFYADQTGSADGVASQLVRQLSDPRPADRSVTRQLVRYKRLARRWQEWSEVVGVCRQLAAHMVEIGP